MFNKNLFLIDTETAGSIGYPRPYDVSYLIGNPQTKEILCSRAYVVREIWEDEELMASAYYASKRELYQRDIESGKRKVLPWAVICKIIREDMAKYIVRKSREFIAKKGGQDGTQEKTDTD